MLASAFEILGPIMVGPSSSHTAGALRLARVARSIAPAPITSVTFTLYNSFAQTYEGHGTNKALVAGILGMDTQDVRIKHALTLAQEAGLGVTFEVSRQGAGLHPNTVDICMALADGKTITVRGESLGGARVRLVAINHTPVSISGDVPTLFIAHADACGVLAALTTLVSDAGINIATLSTYRDAPGGRAFTCITTDGATPPQVLAALKALPSVEFATDVIIPGTTPAPTAHTASDAPHALPKKIHAFEAATTMHGIERLCEKEGLTLAHYARERELLLGSPGATLDDLDARMDAVQEAMMHAAHATLTHPKRSLGGLLDGQAASVYATLNTATMAPMGDVMTTAAAYAMSTLEESASMGVIVAAPTAGSAGVVPGVLLALKERLGSNQQALHDALWTAACIGAVLSANATVSGAEGGCQAEVGVAAAMAAAAATTYFTKDNALASNAAALALSNLLGLVCDPAGGLVEYPCQNRNVIGVASALTACQLSLAGVKSVVPLDEVGATMLAVGHALPEALRETAQGGLATCPSAQKAVKNACSRCHGCA